jgi:hypothetical protein
MLTKPTIVKYLREDDEETDCPRLQLLREDCDFEVKGYKFAVENSHGGYEGAGEEYHIVISITKDDEKSFWKIPGWYQSHYGSELEPENMFEVEEVEKVIKVWEKKKKSK